MKKCENCEFWARYKERLGECVMPSVPEATVKIIVRKQEGGIWVNDDSRKGAMLTEADFHCSGWQERKWR